MKRLILIICMTLLIVACKEQVEEPIPKVELVFRITWKAYSGRGEAISRIVDNFNENSLLYHVTLMGGDEDLMLIRSELVEEKTDVFVLPYRFVQIFGEEKVLAPIILNTKEMTISESLLQMGNVNDQFYGLPWVSHSMALLYNKSILESAGVDPSLIQSRESFVKALEQVVTKTESDGIGLVGAKHNDLSWMVNQFIYGSGGALIENDDIIINSTESKKGIDYYMNILSHYAQPSWQTDTGVEVMEAFKNETIAFEIQGLWGITDIWKNGNPFEVGIIPLKNIGANAEVGPMMLSYRRGLSDEKQAGAEAFLAYMTSVEAQEKIMLGEYSPEHDQYYPFRLPVRDDILQSDAFLPYLIFKTYIESYDFPSIDVPTPAWGLIKETFYTEYLHQLVLNKITVDDFLKLIEEKGSILIEEAK